MPKGRPVFPISPVNNNIVNGLEAGDLQLGDTTAKLSYWIYASPDDIYDTQLPVAGLRLDEQHVHVDPNISNIQWAVVTSDDTVYVVFKGTDNFGDVIIDMNLSSINAFSGDDELVVVHGGMWNELRSADDMSTDKIKKILKAVIANNPNIKVVLCGHSLGGAYAILCAFELLHDGVEVHHVIGHGAPQVIRPNIASEAWKKLNRITTIYVNEYDVVPRLPSCHKEWKETLEELNISGVFSFYSFKSWAVGKVTNMAYPTILKQVWTLCARAEKFRHVGRLIFAAKDDNGEINCLEKQATTESGDAGGWHTLKNPPKWSGIFIIDNHKEYPEVLELLLLDIDIPEEKTSTETGTKRARLGR